MTRRWIAVDWGTSCLRCWHMGPEGILAEERSDAGMSSLAQDGFEEALTAVISPWLEDTAVNVFACGMVGARQGWAEAPYRIAPCPAAAGSLLTIKTQDPRIRMHVMHGVSQAAPPDVMRGEETQIAGLLSVAPEFDGVVCLPGTHTKWVRVSAGEICHFRTAMTGEMFDLLAHRSVLRHAVDEGWQEEVFATALEDALTRPERLATELFGIRAENLLQGAEKGRARARLSGLLIGSEMAAMRPYWLGQDIAVIGAEGLAERYATALAQLGVRAQKYDVTAMTLAGLTHAQKALTP